MGAVKDVIESINYAKDMCMEAATMLELCNENAGCKSCEKLNNLIFDLRKFAKGE